MQILFAKEPYHVYDPMTRNPDEEAIYVRTQPPRIGSNRLNTREALLRCLQRITTLIADFDGTLHSGNQWRLIEEELEKTHPEIVAHLRALRTWYETKESRASEVPADWWRDSYHPASKDAIHGAWVSASITPMVTARWTRNHIRHVARRVAFREGARSLLAHSGFAHKLINTMGVGDFVEEVLFNNGLPGIRTAATGLVFGKGGHILGHGMNVVTSATKGVASRRFLDVTGTTGSSALTIGDGVFDIHMAPEGALRVFLLAHDADQGTGDDRKSHIYNRVVSIWDHADVIVRSNSLTSLVDLLREAHAT